VRREKEECRVIIMKEKMAKTTEGREEGERGKERTCEREGGQGRGERTLRGKKYDLKKNLAWNVISTGT